MPWWIVVWMNSPLPCAEASNRQLLCSSTLTFLCHCKWELIFMSSAAFSSIPFCFWGPWCWGTQSPLAVLVHFEELPAHGAVTAACAGFRLNEPRQLEQFRKVVVTVPRTWEKFGSFCVSYTGVTGHWRQAGDTASSWKGSVWKGWENWDFSDRTERRFRLD